MTLKKLAVMSLFLSLCVTMIALAGETDGSYGGPPHGGGHDMDNSGNVAVGGAAIANDDSEATVNTDNSDNSSDSDTSNNSDNSNNSSNNNISSDSGSASAADDSVAIGVNNVGNGNDNDNSDNSDNSNNSDNSDNSQNKRRQQNCLSSTTSAHRSPGLLTTTCLITVATGICSARKRRFASTSACSIRRGVIVRALSRLSELSSGSEE